jgi:hypothetical protein
MRVISIFAVALSLISTNSLAADMADPSAPLKIAGEANGPLAPGKAAGVAKAQVEDNMWLWTGAGLATLGIIILATQSGSQSSIQTTTTQ